MMVLIVVALLTSGAGLGASLRHEADAAVVTGAPTGERSVERVHGRPFEREGVRQTAFLRATAPAISRVQPPSGAAGTDVPRAAAATGAESLLLALVLVRAAGRGADARRRHIPLPERPALSSRAPPAA